ncbi:hypothetical protein M3Y99_02001800 [Aphelenchoides fujianensis]|nr:hypothetical protein M3Y99_02001800 [Aphelenchoides fujianensis]
MSDAKGGRSNLSEDEHETPPKVQLKLRANVRRALMVHALSTKLEHNQPTVGVDYLRERAALRLRTLRMFCCCRAFPTAFFTPYEKQKKRHFSTLFLYNDNVNLRSPPSGAFELELKHDHARVTSLKRLLLLGRLNVRHFLVSARSFGEPTMDTFRDWAEVLTPLRSFQHSERIQLMLTRTHKTSGIYQLLRDAIPQKIDRFHSSCYRDFLLFSPQFPIIGDIALYTSYYQQSFVAQFFQVRARIMRITNYVPEMAANGRFELNEAVQRVIINLQRAVQPKKLPLDSLGTSTWGQQEVSDFCTAFKNLRSLNDAFNLQIILPSVQLADFGAERKSPL